MITHLQNAFALIIHLTGFITQSGRFLLKLGYLTYLFLRHGYKNTKKCGSARTRTWEPEWEKGYSLPQLPLCDTPGY